MIVKPNYERSILSIAASVLKHFGVTDCPHKTLPELDGLLEKNYKNIVVMLFDGMGISAINEHLSESSFLRKHLICPISSVFPSTTVAATTAIETGYSPVESAWLGWDLFFEEIGENVSVFRNTLQRNGEPAAEYHVAGKYIPVKRIWDRINEINENICTEYISPFSPYKTKSVEDICSEVCRITEEKGRKYIYTYWYQPDAEMHSHGVSSKQAHKQIELINREVERLCGKLRNSLVIVTADHGLCDSRAEYFEDYPELLSMLKYPPSIEPRALSLFVKDGMQAEFSQKFKSIFGDGFRLMTKQEVYAEGLLGSGAPHKRTDGFIGDFLAVATGDVALYNFREDYEFIGVHAGITESEMLVPFIVVET